MEQELELLNQHKTLSDEVVMIVHRINGGVDPNLLSRDFNNWLRELKSKCAELDAVCEQLEAYESP